MRNGKALFISTPYISGLDGTVGRRGLQCVGPCTTFLVSIGEPSVLVRDRRRIGLDIGLILMIVIVSIFINQGIVRARLAWVGELLLLRCVLLSYLRRAWRQNAFVGQTYHEPHLFVAAHVLHVDGYLEGRVVV